ncbi:MAG: FG-GAP repeat domain-containing protein, partial [Acidobacteriota bacterium]
MRGARSPVSRRRKRLRWTWTWLLAMAIVGGGIAISLHLTRRSVPHHPGEVVPGLTRSLSGGTPEAVPRPRFSEVARQAGIRFRQFSGSRSSQLPEDMGSGAAWGDFDNDGDEDLFLVSSGGRLDLPAEQRAASELYENLGDGTFRKAADFEDLRIVGMGAAWADYDGDGWLDLVVSGYGSLVLFHNEEGRLRRRPGLQAPAGFWAGVSWGDYDRDGDPDLYVCGYVRYEPDTGMAESRVRQYGREVPLTLNPSAYEPERNLLFRNDGAGRFTEVGKVQRVDDPEGRSLGGLWHDFDGDGWIDLYVANDVSDNAFFLNRRGHFEEVSHTAWVADYRGAMGLAVGDRDGDGDDDLFISHWVAQENALYDSLLAQTRAGGESRSSSPVHFVDVADQVGLGQIALPMVGWGTEFADLDADGWLDLIVANGSTLEEDHPPPRLKPQRMFLFWNESGTVFHDLAP